MDTHQRIAAGLHVIAGSLSLLVFMVAALFFGHMFLLTPRDTFAMSIFAAAGLGGVFAVGEIVAGVYYLRRSRNARIWLIVFGGLQLPNIPFGTVLGLYTLWAMLRAEAADSLLTAITELRTRPMHR
jgi:hypothetical protein